MKTSLISIGTPKSPQIRDLVAEYHARLKHFCPFSHIVINDIKGKTLSPEAQKKAEGVEILRAVTPSDFLVLFDERGQELTSEQLAQFLAKKSTTLPGTLFFVIGGPFGFSPEVYSRADLQIALSRLTFTHELALLLASEQLYRAHTIIANLPYHHK